MQNQPLFQKGFVLIELILAVTLISIISAVGASTYQDFAANKTVATAADEVANVMQTAKSKAISQVKPSTGPAAASCATSELVGYQVVSCPGGCTTSQKYQLQIVCGATPTTLADYYLPPGVSFNPTSQQTTLFRILTGVVDAPPAFSVLYKGKTRYVGVTRQGVIIASAYSPTTPTPTATVTPSPTSILPTSTPGPAAPSVNISANPDLILPNGTSTLTWTSSKATTCTASGSWSGSKPTNGTQSTTLASVGVHTFTITCAGEGGSSSDSDNLTVNSAPTISFAYPNPNEIFNYGPTVSVVVNATDPDSGDGITKVELWVDGVKKTDQTSAPYGWGVGSASLPVGTHTLRAVAYDSKGVTSEQTITIKIVTPLSGWSNAGFESGNTVWTNESPAIATMCQETVSCPLTTPAEAWYYYMGGAVSKTDKIYQTIAIPSGATNPSLSFIYAICVDTLASTNTDNFYVKIMDSSGSQLVQFDQLTEANATSTCPSNTPVWVNSPVYNLTPYKGQTIRVRFSSATGADSNKSSFLIDNVVVY